MPRIQHAFMANQEVNIRARKITLDAQGQAVVTSDEAEHLKGAGYRVVPGTEDEQPEIVTSYRGPIAAPSRNPYAPVGQTPTNYRQPAPEVATIDHVTPVGDPNVPVGQDRLSARTAPTFKNAVIDANPNQQEQGEQGDQSNQSGEALDPGVLEILATIKAGNVTAAEEAIASMDNTVVLAALVERDPRAGVKKAAAAKLAALNASDVVV